MKILKINKKKTIQDSFNSINIIPLESVPAVFHFGSIWFGLWWVFLVGSPRLRKNESMGKSKWNGSVSNAHITKLEGLHQIYIQLASGY